MNGLGDLDVQDAPFAYYRQRLAACPVWHEEDLDLYVIGGLTEAREALTDTASFSNRPASRRHLRADPGALAYHQRLAERGWAPVATLQRTDPPVHTHYRKLLNRVFTAAKVRELTPHIDEIVHQLIDAFIDRGRCEFVEEFAVPMPGRLIAEQLGLDKSDYLTFRRWADAMLSLAQRSMTVEEAVIEADIHLESQHFLAAEFERRRQHPTDDLISLLVHAHGEDDEPLSVEELQDLMHQLITGGFETTSGGLATAMLLLIEHPDQREALRARPELIKNFIEESLRFDSPVQGLWRHATCPVEVAGVAIPEGASVMVRYGAANRDARGFTEPDRFDVARGAARNHVAFGLGPHYCVGAALARQEMLSSFSAILQRMDDFALAEPMPTPSHDPSYFLRPMKRLPITFSRR